MPLFSTTKFSLLSLSPYSRANALRRRLRASSSSRFSLFRKPRLQPAPPHGIALKHQRRIGRLNQFGAFHGQRHTGGTIHRVAQHLQKIVRQIPRSAHFQVKILENRVRAFQHADLLFLHIVQRNHLSALSVDVGIAAFTEIIIPHDGLPELFGVQSVPRLVVQKPQPAVLGDFLRFGTLHVSVQLDRCAGHQIGDEIDSACHCGHLHGHFTGGAAACQNGSQQWIFQIHLSGPVFVSSSKQAASFSKLGHKALFSEQHLQISRWQPWKVLTLMNARLAVSSRKRLTELMQRIGSNKGTCGWKRAKIRRGTRLTRKNGGSMCFDILVPLS
nr:MAG TPA: hypothetical protein [Caudoviricetes sp.]